MSEINSLMDVINELKLDVYKKCSNEDIVEIENGIDMNKRVRTIKKCNEITNSNPLLTFKEQPKNIKFFLPPIPKLLEELGTNVEEQLIAQNEEMKKKDDEELEAFAYRENMLVAVYKNKAKDYVFYTYHYDYKETHQLLLMSRVAYE